MGCIIKYKGQSIPEEQFLQYLNKQIAINNLFNENTELASQIYEAARFKNNYKDAAGTGNLIDELKKIEAPHLKELADLFISLNIDIPLYYSKSQEYLFVTTDNTIIIPKNAYGILKQKSIIHELLHAGTSNGLLSNSKFKSEIENLIKNIKDSDQQGRITFNYELQNADEFISGLSEKSFVDFLKRKGIYDNVLSLVKNNLEFKKGFQITPQQKQQATFMFSEFLERGGSQEDIQGFKDFVQDKQFQKLTAEEKAKTIDRHADSYFTKNNAFFIDHVTSEAMFDNIKSYLFFHYPGIKTYDDYRNYIFELNDKDTILNFINFVTKC